MKVHSLGVVLAAGLMLTVPGRAAAQAQPAAGLPRADAWGAFGWSFDRTVDEDAYRADGSRRVLAGAGAGFYWAPALKLEVDTNTPTRVAVTSYSQRAGGPGLVVLYSRIRYDRWGVSAVQHYEFLKNAWFTPYAGVGLEVLHERRVETVSGLSDPTQATRTIGPDDRTVARPLVAAGFKAYMSRRAFFRTDTRVAFERGVRDVKFRCGFGMDF